MHISDVQSTRGAESGESLPIQLVLIPCLGPFWCKQTVESQPCVQKYIWVFRALCSEQNPFCSTNRWFYVNLLSGSLGKGRETA